MLNFNMDELKTALSRWWNNQCAICGTKLILQKTKILNFYSGCPNKCKYSKFI